MNPQPGFQNIALDALRISPRNARKTDTDITDLAASIITEGGLLQNLVVALTRLDAGR